MEQNGPQPFRFRDARQERIYRRLLLIGEGPAAFYRDACKLMEDPQAFEAASHLVCHLLRDVESALRDVLEPQTEGTESRSQSGENHRESITRVLQALGVDGGDPLAEFWLSLPREVALSGKAHRNALFPPRPVDEEFRELWNSLQAFLDSVLGMFQDRYLDYHPLLDELAAIQDPKRSDAKRLKNRAPNNAVAYGYFLQKDLSPKWLQLLHKEGVFSYPPPLETDGDVTRFPLWPQSRYLQQMAKDEPRTVADIILDIPDTENVSVLTDLAEAACRMPPEQAMRLLDRAKSWVKTPWLGAGLLAEYLGRLTAHLAEGNHVDPALELARTLLAVRPASAGRQADDPAVASYLRQRPEGLFRDWDYKEVLRLRMPTLVRAGGLRSLRLLCHLLDEAVTIHQGPPENGALDEDVQEDLSIIWRPTLEGDARESREDVLNSLVTAVRDAAEQIARDDTSLLAEIVGTLEGYPWMIFKRLALRLLHIFHPDAPVLVYERLTDKSVIHESHLDREYIQLLQDAFPSLEAGRQHEILQLIDQGPDLKGLGEEDDNGSRARRWKWRRLSHIKEQLSGDWALVWKRLQAEFGDESELPEYGRVAVRWGGPTAVGADKLSSMPSAEIVAFIVGFEPSDGFSEPSAEDLASELADAVPLDPERFSSHAPQFRDLAPEYLEGFVRGFRNAAEGGKPIGWKPVLDFCTHVLDRAAGEDAWRQVRRDVVDLLHSGLAPKGTETPFEFRDQVWTLIDRLVEDPEPSPEYEALYLGSGPYHLAINSTRGRAMETAVLYGLWVYRCTKPAGAEQFDFSLEIVPELKAALEHHLDPTRDPSLAVRSIYGAFLPVLHGLDSKWVTANLGRIFPSDGELIQLRSAAWETYLCWSNGFNLSMLELLRDEYGRAIELLGSPTLEERGRPEERLGQHLMIFYWHGKLELRDPLLDRFFESAPGAVRGQALGSVGRSLRAADAQIPSEVTPRLRALWEWRAEASRDDAAAHAEEMAAFGWWFPYEGLDEDWALEQLEASLTIASKVDIDHAVVERLAALAPPHPALTVRCFGLMIDGAEEDWQIRHWSSHAETVLTEALRSGDLEADRMARALINRLATRGFLDFKRLLNGT